MSYIKNGSPGKITMDLPRSNYIYELPLFSFGNIQDTVNLSLVYNYHYKCENVNPFFVKEGFKLNIQKAIRFVNGVPTYLVEANGKYTDLNSDDGYPYAFDDESQRILRQSGIAAMPYVIENPDYSKEYYNSLGLIAAVVNKYGDYVLRYNYNTTTGRLNSVNFRNSKTIAFMYSGNCIAAIGLSGTTGSVTLGYSDNGMTVTRHSGEVCNIVLANTMDFTATNTSSANSTEVRKTGDCSLAVYDYINSEKVNETTYEFPELATEQFAHNIVEITNNEGVKTRIQYKDGEMMYAYEVVDSDVTFSSIAPQKYCGSVQIYKTIDDMGADDYLETEIEMEAETEYSAKHVREYGTIGMNDGIPMQLNNASLQRWYYDASVYSNNTDFKGYYLLTGWVKSKNNDVNYNDGYLCVSNYAGGELIDFRTDLTPGNQWKFFAYKFSMSANFIYVYPRNTSLVELKDLRLTFEPTTTESSGNTTHICVSEHVLICPDGVYAPICSAQFSHGNVDISNYGQVYFDDLFKYKVNKVKGVNANEVYCNECKKALVVSNSGSYTVTYNGENYDLDDCKLAILQYTINKTVITEISENITLQKLTYRTFYKGSGNNDIEISLRELNSYLDVVSETVDGVTKTYTRNSEGLLTYENISGLCTRNIAYDTQNLIISVTDEFGNVTRYTLDSTWGGVKSVTLPNETVVTDEYDDDMCTFTKRIFGNTSGRSNSLAYSNGNLSTVETGGLSYDFAYSDGKLSAVSKNDAKVEEHVYTGNTEVESYYPTESGALHSTKAEFDMYGKLLSIDGILENAYTIFPAFNSAGVMTTNINNASSILGMTTDKTTGEVSRFSYDTKGKLLVKTVTSETDFSEEISEESFEYDDANRLIEHTTTYDSANSKYVSDRISYRKNADHPLADKVVSNYTYKVNGEQKAYSVNSFDTFNRRYMKETTFTYSPFIKTFNYDNFRVTSQADTFLNKNLGTNNYSFDNMGRIVGDSYSCAYSPSDYRTYEYDQYGQLVRENNQGLDKTFVYEYDGIGNISRVKEYDYTLNSTPSGTYTTTSFGYTADKLTTFGGATIAYNTMGCPTTYEGKTATWTRGKLSKLSSGTMTTGISSYTYTYNAFGQRIRKNYTYTPGKSSSAQLGELLTCAKTYYYDHAGRLISENVSKTYYGVDGSSESIVFLYDDSGIIGMVRTVGSTSNTYYFQRNLLGDVVAIYDTSGNMVAKYLYDAWGNCTISSETTNTVVANANPIRYRGYYYDDDTGLYYCNARYYSPKWRRFISPDDTAYLDPESVNGLNLYCYCNNDPIGIKHTIPARYMASVIADQGYPLRVNTQKTQNSVHWKGTWFDTSLPSFLVFSTGKASLVDWGLSVYKGSLYFDEAENHSLYISLGNVSVFAGLNVEKDKYGVFADANVLSAGYDGRYIDAGVSIVGVGFILGFENKKFRIKVDPPGFFGFEIAINFRQIIKDLFGWEW